MPDVGKKRASPVNAKASTKTTIAEVRESKENIEEKPENDADVIETIAYPSETAIVVNDAMKNEPTLYNLIVEKYEGSFDENGFYEGEGTAFYFGGRKYCGSFKSGRMNGDGVYEWENGITYSGSFLDGKICGQGVYTLNDGSTYEGAVDNGLRNGYGTFRNTLKNCSYSGHWKNSQRHGKGIIYFDESGLSYYDGDWIDGKKCGYGIRRFSNGHMYEGHWKDDKRHGEGTMYWYNLGQEYSGNWVNGIPEGFGKSTWFLKRVSKSQYPLRNHYVGQFQRGMRHGHGTFYYANSAIYEGEWRYNQKHGQGMFTFKNGSVFKGIFENDKIKEYPNLILSGMNTPDIIQHNIPVQKSLPSSTNTRPVSVLEPSIIEKSIDPFLDVDINDILIDLKCNADTHEAEASNIFRIFLRFATTLKHIYKFYSSLGSEQSIDNTFVMEKLQFWRFLLDCKLVSTAHSVMDIEEYLDEEHNLESCHKKIFFRDFLSNLVKISYYFFEDEFTEENYVISSCLEKLVTKISEFEPIVVGGCLFVDLERSKEMLSIVDDILNIYFYFCDYFSKARYNSKPIPRDSPFKLRHIFQIFKQMNLVTNKFRGKELTKILTKEYGCHHEDGEYNMEQKTSPLEFLEIIFATPSLFIDDDIIEQHFNGRYVNVLPVFELSPTKSDHNQDTSAFFQSINEEINSENKVAEEVMKSISNENDTTETSPSKLINSINPKQTSKQTKKKDQKKIEKENSTLLNANRSRDRKEGSITKIDKKKSVMKNEDVKNKSTIKKEGSDASVPKLSPSQTDYTNIETIVESELTKREDQNKETIKQDDVIETCLSDGKLSNVGERTVSKETSNALTNTKSETLESYEMWKMKHELFFHKFFFRSFRKLCEINEFKVSKKSL